MKGLLQWSGPFAQLGQWYNRGSGNRPARPPPIEHRAWSPNRCSTLSYQSLSQLSLPPSSAALCRPKPRAAPLPPPTSRLSTATTPGEVIITWVAVPEATHYRFGYVNMNRDYARAKAGVTGDWREVFSHVDVDAQNFEQGTTYTLYGLQEGARHAFAVLTNDSRYGEPTWPSNPAWQFLTVTDWGGACPTAVATPGTPLSNVELTRRVRPALVQLTVTPLRRRNVLRNRLCSPVRWAGGHQPPCD